MAEPKLPKANGDQATKPPAASQILALFLAKIAPFGENFDQIHQQIVLRLSENIHNFDDD